MWALNTVLWTKNHRAHLIGMQVWRKKTFFLFSISLFKESTMCTWTASVQELQGAPGANRHFHESESDYLSTQLMRMNQLCDVLNGFNMKSQPAKIQQSINKNVITRKGESAVHVNHKENPTSSPLSTTRRSSSLDLTSPALQSLHALNLCQGKGKNIVSPLTILY